MLSRKFIAPALGAVTFAAIAFALTAARRSPTLESTDFGKVIRKTNPSYDAKLADASDADIKSFRIPIKDAVIEIANGVKY